MITTVTPTIMDGTVVRWYTSENSEDRGDEIASASRNRAVIEKGAPAWLFEAAENAHQELRRDPDADMSHLATHKRSFLFGPLVPVLTETEVT